MANRRYPLTKQDLIDARISVKNDGKNPPRIFQIRDPELHGPANNWQTERPQAIVTTKHKYGVDKSYKTVGLRVHGKKRTFLVSNIVWIYFNDAIPEDSEVDHINDNSLDDRLENLQILTKTENIQKRKFNGANQFYNSTNEVEFLKFKEKRNGK